MQTPETAYPATLEDLPNGKPKVRSQFVYSVHNPSQNVSQCKMLKEEDFNSDQGSSELRNSLEQASNATSTSENGLKKMSHENESKLEVSLSPWLKLVSVIREERDIWMETPCSHIPRSRKTLADRPIIGKVAAHWNEEEDAHIPPPERQDGNGIPNSITKYKEDQKEAYIVKSIAFDENEETDTALSAAIFNSSTIRCVSLIYLFSIPICCTLHKRIIFTMWIQR